MKKDKITMAGLRKYLSLFERAGVYWISLLFIPVMEVFVSAINALFYQKIINAVTVSDMALLKASLWIAIVVLVASMVRCLIIYGYMYQIRRIMQRLRLRVMGHLFRLPMSYFEGHHTADSIQKLCFNVEDIKTSLANRHQQVINPFLIGGSAIILILMLDFRIGIMVLIMSLVSVRVNMILSRPLRDMAVRIQKLFASCTERLTDVLAGMDIIKMFSGAWRMLDRYSDVNADVTGASMKRFRRMADVQAVEWAFGFLCNIVILIIGVFMSFAGMVDFGTVVAILSLQGMVSYFLSNIGSAWGALMDCFVLADRVFEILDEPEQAADVLAVADKARNEADNARNMTEHARSETGNVRNMTDNVRNEADNVRNMTEHARNEADNAQSGTDNVQTGASAVQTVLTRQEENNGQGIVISDAVFSYDGSGDEAKKTLQGVDITVEKGKTVALVGESGGGKSTIVKLILGFYQLDSGTIKVLGKPLSEYNLNELHSRIAYVPQDAYLFATSIRENIRYGRPGASDEEVVKAARRAYAHEFIMAFPNGYDTLVGERGESLSGGQRQRIAIARAFIRNAPILLLDEATSALDTESERLVQKGIEALMGGRTTLVVAHRLSTIEKADMIYVIGGGQVCEKGKHTELMAQNGAYRKLVELDSR